MATMMKCGHVANAIDEAGNPVCVICVGITPNATIVAEDVPNLDGREAACPYCNKKTKSSTDLPFFDYRPNETHDSYYCGCFGWD